MYPATTVSSAFMLYCQGHSFRRIAEILKTHPGCEKITHGTVKGWAEKPDENGKSWSERRKESMALMRASEQEAVVRSQREIIAETSAVLDDVLDEIRTGGLEFKTKDAAMYAFKSLIEWQEKAIDREKQITIEDQVTLMLEAMYEIPEVSEVLSKHRKAIEKLFQEKALLRLREKHGR